MCNYVVCVMLVCCVYVPHQYSVYSFVIHMNIHVWYT